MISERSISPSETIASPRLKRRRVEWRSIRSQSSA
jgi:hypothetical protein